MRERLYRWLRQDDAAVATEYAILLGVVALVIIAGALAFGSALNNDFNNGSSQIANFVSGS